MDFLSREVFRHETLRRIDRRCEIGDVVGAVGPLLHRGRKARNPAGTDRAGRADQEVGDFPPGVTRRRLQPFQVRRGAGQKKRQHFPLECVVVAGLARQMIEVER